MISDGLTLNFLAENVCPWSIYKICTLYWHLAIILHKWLCSPTGSIVFILLMLVFVVLVLGASLAMSAWWIADLVIFATNQRLSGNGCILTPNLWGEKTLPVYPVSGASAFVKYRSRTLLSACTYISTRRNYKFHSVGSEKDRVSGRQLQYPIKSSFGKESNLRQTANEYL